MMLESLQCGVHHGGSDGYTPCKFPRQCVCRLYKVRDELVTAVEDLFEHAKMGHALYSALNLTGDGLVGRASRSVDKHYFLPTWIKLENILISVIDGAKLALDHMNDGLFKSDDFESATGLQPSFYPTLTWSVVPQPSASYPLEPIDPNQPWRQFLDNDAWVMFANLWLQLNVINAMILIRTLTVWKLLFKNYTTKRMVYTNGLKANEKMGELNHLMGEDSACQFRGGVQWTRSILS